MPDDYGYFGKGLTGYAHYMQAFERNNGGGKKPSGRNGGCLSAILLALFAITSFVLLMI